MDPYNDKFLQFGSPPPAPQSNWDKFKTIAADALTYLAPPPPKFETVKKAAVGIGKALLPPDPYEEAGKMVQQVRQGDYLGAAETGWGSLPMQGGIRAYHGSPHSFDKFSTDKIGAGEGAQAYGHGLYFADSEDVARSYRNNLSPNAVLIDGQKYVPQHNTPEQYALSALEMGSHARGTDPYRLASAHLRNNMLGLTNPEDLKPWQEAQKILEDWKAKGATPVSAGHMYEVDINANPEHMLDWDTPLYRQHPSVQQAFGLTPETIKEYRSAQNSADDALLAELFDEQPAGNMTDLGRKAEAIRRSMVYHPDMTGEEAYQKMLSSGGSSWHSPNKSVDASVSQRLLEKGIPGIKYLDQMSRSAGEGSRNYVVFDDKMVNILRKYGFVPFGLAGVPYGGGGEEQK